MAESTEIIEQYARHLEQKASALITRFTLLSGLVGGVLGGFPLVKVQNPVVPPHLGYATLLLGALAGAYLGYRSGERRAVGLRLQAQMALRQLQLEQSLFRRVVQPAPAPAAPVVQQPAPVVPAPQPVAPVVQQPVAPPLPVAPVLQPVVPAPAPAPEPVPVAAPAPTPPPVVAPAPAPIAPPPVTPPAAVAAPPLSSAAQ
jgi:outer membrane biosynthesis protein TonB